MSETPTPEALQQRIDDLEMALRPFASAAAKGKQVYSAMLDLRSDPRYPLDHGSAHIRTSVSVAESFVSWADWDRARRMLEGGPK